MKEPVSYYKWICEKCYDCDYGEEIPNGWECPSGDVDTDLYCPRCVFTLTCENCDTFIEDGELVDGLCEDCQEEEVSC